MHNPNDLFDDKRFGLITGSECHVLFPDRGDGKAGQTTYARNLASNMFWRFYDNNSTWQTEHGNLAESTAYEFYTQRFDRALAYRPNFMVKGEFGGAADAVNPIASYGVDFKCPTSLIAWQNYLFDGISKQQYHQCQMYMHLWDVERWYVCAYLLETDRMANNGEQYPVPLEDRMIRVVVEREHGWWNKLEQNAQFVIEKRNEFYNILKEKFKK